MKKKVIKASYKDYKEKIDQDIQKFKELQFNIIALEFSIKSLSDEPLSDTITLTHPLIRGNRLGITWLTTENNLSFYTDALESATNSRLIQYNRIKEQLKAVKNLAKSIPANKSKKYAKYKNKCDELIKFSKKELEETLTYKALQLQQTQENLNLLEKDIADQRAIINQNNVLLTAVNANAIKLEQEANNLGSENNELEAKIREVQNRTENFIKEEEELMKFRDDLLNNLTPKQQGFILQKALDTNQTDIISLFIDPVLDLRSQDLSSDSLNNSLLCSALKYIKHRIKNPDRIEDISTNQILTKEQDIEANIKAQEDKNILSNTLEENEQNLIDPVKLAAEEYAASDDLII